MYFDSIDAQIEDIFFEEISLGQSASRHCSAAVLVMPKLLTLGFHNVKLDYQFFSMMTDIRHDSKVRVLCYFEINHICNGLQVNCTKLGKEFTMYYPIMAVVLFVLGHLNQLGTFKIHNFPNGQVCCNIGRFTTKIRLTNI